MEDFDEIDYEGLELFNKDKLLLFRLYYCQSYLNQLADVQNTHYK
jgi:hypothetical protein